MGRLVVRVQPGSRRTEFCGWFGDDPQHPTVRVRVAAPPIDGAANEALVGFLATAFGVRRADVRIVGGGAARSKRIEVAGRTDGELRDLVTSLQPSRVARDR